MSQEEPQFRDLTDEELRSMFLAAASGNTADANHFFGSFKYVHDLFNGNHSAALNQGLSLLTKCRSIDENAYARIHKGTAYYWLGTAAFLVHDYQTATFFYDAAVSEDLRAGNDPVNNSTPALRFIQIEGEQPHQAARPLVMATQARIEEIIDNYNKRPGRPTNVPDFHILQLRERFLRLAVSQGYEGWRSLATVLISFVLEWDYRSALLDLRVGQGTAEPFFIHLFKGCVLFESLLKANPKDPPPRGRSTLIGILQYLHKHLGLPHDIKIGETDFTTILQELNHADNSIPTAVRFAGKIRNTVGHDLGWVVQFDKTQYHLLFQMVAVSCLHSIACLY